MPEFGKAPVVRVDNSMNTDWCRPPRHGSEITLVIGNVAKPGSGVDDVLTGLGDA